MYAVTIAEPGGPDVLRWSEVDDPVPGPEEVVIEVAAAGVNRADLLQRAGHYPAPPGGPAWPGPCSPPTVTESATSSSGTAAWTTSSSR